MLRAHTVEQIRAAEAALMATLPPGTLMQRAGAGLAYAVVEFLGGAYGRRVLLLVGNGDNGGDALVAGAKLASRGVKVDVWRAGMPVPAGAYDAVVDGIVGIGGRPGLRPEAAAVVAALAGVPVVAVDLPSGVAVDSGELDGPHVRADLTVTFGTHKLCHLVDPAASACGAVHLVDLGLDLPDPEAEALQADDVAALLPRPDPQAQKYTRGVAGVRAGSAQYPGAALLSVAGATTGLAGMVRYVGSAEETVKQHHPEVVGAGRVQAWVVGSGSGAGAAGQLEEALADGVPVVVDADALAALAARRPRGVLTPHAGELAQLLGVERTEVEARPLAHVRQAAQAYGCTVLLKGRRTLVATPGRPLRVNLTGTPWLATAGAGDVLGGLIASLLAAGLDPHDAASAGAWLHGAAATAAARGGPLTASLVADALRGVIADLLGMGD